MRNDGGLEFICFKKYFTLAVSNIKIGLLTSN